MKRTDPFLGKGFDHSPLTEAEKKIDGFLGQWEPVSISPKDALNGLINPSTNHHDYLLFYFWYECHFKQEIMLSRVLASSTENKGIHYVRCRNKKLEKEVYQESLKYLFSDVCDGFTVYHEYYKRFLGDIGHMSFDQFRGKEMVDLLLKTFPAIRYVHFKNGEFIHRFDTTRRQSKFPTNHSQEIESTFGNTWVEWGEYDVPVFYPTLSVDPEKWSYTPLALNDFDWKQIENTIRESKKIPKIGEGWISETILFKQIKSWLDIEVIHHGSPNWLGAQHLDIWIPKVKVAIEYQGIQHDKPIEFFGGEEGFQKTRERDERKRNLCVENEVHLIEVRPNYSVKALKKEIISIVQSRLK
jgi:hypothetical protein